MCKGEWEVMVKWVGKATGFPTNPRPQFQDFRFQNGGALNLTENFKKMKNICFASY
jgi:hypothetical protein